MEVPENWWFVLENPIKMDDLGVPLFLDPKMEVPTICKVYCWGLCKGIYSQHMALYGTWYLHFSILEFPLIIVISFGLGSWWPRICEVCEIFVNLDVENGMTMRDTD